MVSTGTVRRTYTPYIFLAFLLAWVILYQFGPARLAFQTGLSNQHTTVYRFLEPIFDWALPVFAIVFGFGVVALKPKDVKAWLLLAFVLSFAEGTRMGENFTSSASWLRTMATTYQSFGEHAWSACFLLFLIYFPSRARIDKRWPWLKWALLAPLGIEIVLSVGQDLHLPGAATLLQSQGFVPQSIFDVAMGCALALLSGRYFMAQTEDERRRLRLFYWGILISLLPALAIVYTRDLLHRHDLNFAPGWLVLFAFALLALLPAVLAYVILVQRAMDVRVVVRQGIRYALASRGVIVIRAAAIVGVIYVAVLLTDRQKGIWPQVAAISIGIVVVNSIRSMADNARKWIDKRFFREQLRTEELLGSLANDVHRIVRTDELVQTVAQRIASSLHVDHIAVWLANAGALVPVYATGSDGWNVATVLDDLRENKKAFVVESGQVGRGAEVVVPLAAREELLGTIVLGTKRSEEPYSRMELDVLETVGSQAGLALDNSRLANSLAQEAAQRERLNREIEIAREVQQTLLPQGGPAVPGIEYAGICRPALGVGGDYYDFLQLPGGRFGFAIGDVSGKGVAAALLMASLQASLRGQTLDASDDLASIVSRMNRLLFEATAPNRYATFFYAQYDPASRSLTWVNAGHNPPFLFHNGEIRRLDEGGAVIGLLPDMEYTQGSTALACGDLLLAFTDGISESMNAQDEEWGEDRLRAEVTSCAESMPIPSMLSTLLACADAHAAGAPQHDDMTLVAIRALRTA
ncbi:MAG TPA: GAF domain-containing SpoIIE family protein phosphatase [Candidatus Acidoferrales bacterium]|nr:GAF domain-containing SpoIIE family protein phosphatase [Candidatus Acidoferrales bacterium]